MAAPELPQPERREAEPRGHMAAPELPPVGRKELLS
jgi:hypothetical protein